jgi:TfoX/Sxy family transcriptional regulator of competence genes
MEKDSSVKPNAGNSNNGFGNGITSLIFFPYHSSPQTNFMAYNEELANRIRQALAHRPDVKEKKMFGGLAFMVDDKMCITAGPDRIMCRIDPALHEEATTKKGCRGVIMKGRELKGYVHVKEDAIRTARELQYWVELSLEFNSMAKSSKKK